ncbi:MAG: branched-chain amino acid ABC transporter permease [Limnochordia bacterium]|nr:branched-chain amino acid ABC transporter permease [Bacillota bacterium]
MNVGLVQALLSGLLMGFVYSLIALGLSLIYGVMDVVNFAHGEFLMLGMFLAYWFSVLFRLDPLISIFIIIPLLFVVGVGVYKGLIKRILNGTRISQILTTFGLSVFMANMAMFLWTPNYRLAERTLTRATGDLPIFGVHVGIPEVIASLGSIIVFALAYYLIRFTRTGRAIQATSIDSEGARLVGINIDNIYAITFGLGISCVGAAGVLLATFYYIFPYVGTFFSMIAFATVALGGFGSVEGSFVAGILIGIIESLGGFFISPAVKYAIVFMTYMVVIILRPATGLFGW